MTLVIYSNLMVLFEALASAAAAVIWWIWRPLLSRAPLYPRPWLPRKRRTPAPNLGDGFHLLELTLLHRHTLFPPPRQIV